MKKRLLPLLLALVFALSLLPVQNAAAEENCTIRFDGNLASDATFAPIEVPKGTKLADVELPRPWPPEQWRFVGWSQYAHGWDRLIEPDEPVTGDMTLYAAWLRLLDEATVYVPTPTAGWSAKRASDPVCFGWWNYYTVEPGSYWTQRSDVGNPDAAYTGDFEAGKTYYGTLDIVPGDGFYVESGSYGATEVTLVGGAELSHTWVFEKDGRETLRVCYSVTVPEQKKISHAELFVDRLVAGSSADRKYARACLTSGLMIEPIDSWWKNEADIEDYGKTMQPSDGFLSGQTYYSYFMLFADEDAEIDFENFTATIHGGKFLGAKRDPDAYEPTILVYFSVDVLEVCAMSVFVEPDVIGSEYTGAYLWDMDPRWETYIDGPSMPAGDRTFTAKAHQGYVFEGWYEAETDEYGAPTGKETLLTHSTTLKINHDRYRRLHCRFAVDPTTLSDLVVCGVAVNEKNAEDVLGDGVFSYDFGTKTLTVRGSVEYYGSAIVSRVQGLTIYVAEDSVLAETDESSAVDFLKFRGDTTITGKGSLTILVQQAPFAVSVLKNAKLTLEGLRGTIRCPAMGVCGDEASEALIVRNCALTIECAPEKALAVDFFGSITVEDCRVSFPKNAKVANNAILDAEGYPAPKVVFSTGVGGNFSDVPPEAYYADPVNWAVENEITNGKTETTFAPAEDCTRGQIVTFLWRAKGCPAPNGSGEPQKGPGNPFADVKESAYYYDAVLWAVENGITNGVDATHFGPGKSCTRAQAVTFLWRAEGQPGHKSTESPFSDVSGGFALDAVLWAVENNITGGTGGGKFSPNKTCTRGQIVTFLYRDMEG